MLGIRKYKNKTIDLWCGESEAFDVPVSITSLDDGLGDIHAWHVAIRPYEHESTIDMEALFSQLQAELSKLPDDAPLERITIIVDDLLHYQRLMEMLYRHFDELPWH